LGVAVDYAVPRNHCEAFEAVDGWQGPENGFAASVDGEMEKGGSVLNYLSDRFNTREWMRETPEFTGELEIKDGDHYIVGTTYGDEFSDYRSKFGFSTESELIRSVTPQRLKDWAKGSRLTGSEF